jgi:phosphatidylserine decarboxylase
MKLRHFIFIIAALSLLTACTTPMESSHAVPPKQSIDASKWKPEIQELRTLIENDSQLYILFNRMFEEIPSGEKFKRTPSGAPVVENYMQMLNHMNKIMSEPPEFNESPQVGCPFNDLLAWPMCTPSGQTAFLNEKLNKQMEKILNKWGKFLTSSASVGRLNDTPPNGWFCPQALAAMPDFSKTFFCDPSKPHYGFTSWDDFFTRKFRPEARPLEHAQDPDSIANPCESAPVKIAHNVKISDEFWLKQQPYSLLRMFGNDEQAKQFIGGTVYQAFLSALSYHRWHSPISGKILKIKNLSGTYYAASPNGTYPPGTPDNSQPYLAHVAARAYAFIESDNPKIGTVGVLFIGMVEVSSCEFTVKAGQHVKKGQELGMFHYGGSTYCMVFEPKVDLEFFLEGQTPSTEAKNIKVLKRIARVKSEKK